MKHLYFTALLLTLGLIMGLVGCDGGQSHARAAQDEVDPSPQDHHEETAVPSVRVKLFNEKGELYGPIEVPKVIKTKEQWKAQLDEMTYRITRESGTELACSGALLENKRDGVYVCVCCGLPLFDARSKFDSGTGWPSFFQPIGETNVVEKRDTSHGMVRVENLCARCDAHLGHVFQDGPAPTGLRYCMNSAALRFVPRDELASLAETPGAKPELAHAVLAGGCFWCTEAVFENLDGVHDVESGYAGGKKETATYDQVSSGATDHAEAIRITYDPAKVSFDKLLEVFFTIAHDPTQLNRQGPDRGRQYRSAVFYETPEQKQQVQDYIKKLEASGHYRDPIVTTLEPLEGFYPAERYHQDYVKLNPDKPYVRFNALPKVEKLHQFQLKDQDAAKP